eukprot:GGOE01007773.1.p2 GENE.GGOE01007773.1~~GGOE01007773.1.p2  ORF type:complete len:140 (-),score=23.74 GGOE01007773.1:576-953(-)
MYNNVKRQEAILNPIPRQRNVRPATASASTPKSSEARDRRGYSDSDGLSLTCRAQSSRELQPSITRAALALPSRKTITDGLRRIENRDKGDLDAWAVRCTAFSTQLNVIHRQLESRAYCSDFPKF